jgi:hypothetical protein
MDILVKTIYNKLILLLYAVIEIRAVDEDDNKFKLNVINVIFGQFYRPLSTIILSINDMLKIEIEKEKKTNSETPEIVEEEMVKEEKDDIRDDKEGREAEGVAKHHKNHIVDLVRSDNSSLINDKIVQEVTKQTNIDYTEMLVLHLESIIEEEIKIAKSQFDIANAMRETYIDNIKKGIIETDDPGSEPPPLTSNDPNDTDSEPPPLTSDDPYDPDSKPPSLSGGKTKYINSKTPKKHKLNKQYFDKSKKKNKKHQNFFNTSLKKTKYKTTIIL